MHLSIENYAFEANICASIIISCNYENILYYVKVLQFIIIFRFLENNLNFLQLAIRNNVLRCHAHRLVEKSLTIINTFCTIGKIPARLKCI